MAVSIPTLLLGPASPPTYPAAAGTTFDRTRTVPAGKTLIVGSKMNFIAPASGPQGALTLTGQNGVTFTDLGAIMTSEACERAWAWTNTGTSSVDVTYTLGIPPSQFSPQCTDVAYLTDGVGAVSAFPVTKNPTGTTAVNKRQASVNVTRAGSVLLALSVYGGAHPVDYAEVLAPGTSVLAGSISSDQTQMYVVDYVRGPESAPANGVVVGSTDTLAVAKAATLVIELTPPAATGGTGGSFFGMMSRLGLGVATAAAAAAGIVAAGSPQMAGQGPSGTLQLAAQGFPDSTTAGHRYPDAQMQRIPEDATSGPGWSWDARGWVNLDPGCQFTKKKIANGKVIPNGGTSVVPTLIEDCDISQTIGIYDANGNLKYNGTTLTPWAPNTAYLAGAARYAPDGMVITAKANFTSGSSFDATNWNYPDPDQRYDAWLVDMRGQIDGLKVRYTTLRGKSSNRWAIADNAVRDPNSNCTNVTIEFCRSWYVSSFFDAYSQGGTVRKNFIHDFGHDPAGGGANEGHFNGMQFQAPTTDLGANTPLMLVDNNTILLNRPFTDCVMCSYDHNPAGVAVATTTIAHRNRTYSNNLWGGGQYPVYARGHNGGLNSGIKYIGNRWTTMYYALSGNSGLATGFDPAGVGNEWTDNRVLDGPNAGRLINASGVLV